MGVQASAVRVLAVSDPAAKRTPDPVNDTEVSTAQDALRDAAAWGAQYYEPRIFARAQAALDAARAAQEGDPVRCRFLLSEATETASSAKRAALLAYEADVESRFDASRVKLVDVGADRAFPDEFAQLVSGIDATVRLFAAGSYQDARFKAYTTLKGMGSLYEMTRGLLDWLRDAQIRVESALSAARSLDAPRWAPTEMRNAEQKYQDALAREAGRRFERCSGFDEGRGPDRAQAALSPGGNGQARDERPGGKRASASEWKTRIPITGFNPLLSHDCSPVSEFGLVT